MINFDYLDTGKYFQDDIPDDVDELAWTAYTRGWTRKLKRTLNFHEDERIVKKIGLISATFAPISPFEFVFVHSHVRKEQIRKERSKSNFSLGRAYFRTRYIIVPTNSVSEIFNSGSAFFERLIESGSHGSDYILQDYDSKIGEQKPIVYDQTRRGNEHVYFANHLDIIKKVSNAVLFSEQRTKYVVVPMPGSKLIERLQLAQEVIRVLLPKLGPISFALDYISDPYPPVRLQFLSDPQTEISYPIEPVFLKPDLVPIDYVDESIKYFQFFSATLEKWSTANARIFSSTGQQILDQFSDPKHAFAQLTTLVVNKYEYVKYCLQSRYPKIMANSIERIELTSSYKELDKSEQRSLVSECGAQKVFSFLFDIFSKDKVVQILLQEDQFTDEHLLILLQKAKDFSQTDILSVKRMIEYFQLGSHVKRLFELVYGNMPSILQTYFRKGNSDQEGLLARLVDQDSTFELLAAMAVADKSIADWLLFDELSCLSLPAIEMDEILGSRVYALFEDVNGIESLVNSRLRDLEYSDTLLKCKLISSLKNRRKLWDDEILFLIEKLEHGHGFSRYILPQLLSGELVSSISFPSFLQWLRAALNTKTLYEYLSDNKGNRLYDSLIEHNRGNEITLEDIATIVASLEEIYSPDNEAIVKIIRQHWIKQILHCIPDKIPYIMWLKEGFPSTFSINVENIFLALIDDYANS